MALHMSIGLLFLGGGRASLSRSKEATAALVAAFFPRFPRSAEDNQYHLQSLRHLWVLAIQWRGFKTIDVDTGKDVQVPLQIELSTKVDYVVKGNADSAVPAQLLRVRAPCLVPMLGDIASVCVTSKRYYSATLRTQDRSHANAIFRLILHVKRRPGHLSYIHDPVTSQRRLQEEDEYKDPGTLHNPLRLLEPWTRQVKLYYEIGVGTSAIVAPYTGDPVLVAFARQFCDHVSVSLPDSESAHRPQVRNDRVFLSPWVEGQAPMERWSARILYECIAYDKPAALILYLQMHHAATTIQSQLFPAQAWSLRIALEYCAASNLSILMKCTNQMPLLRRQFIQALRVHVDAALLSEAPRDQKAALWMILRPALTMV